jgi:hypothetical protein
MELVELKTDVRQTQFGKHEYKGMELLRKPEIQDI